MVAMMCQLYPFLFMLNPQRTEITPIRRFAQNGGMEDARYLKVSALSSILNSQTQLGMTKEQTISFIKNFPNEATEFHHGDCIGADTQAHMIIRESKNIPIHIHEPEIPDKRSFLRGDFHHNPRPYLNRNIDIVDMTDLLIACPKTNSMIIRSGTWFTIRYAKKEKKKIMIIYPSGTIEKINLGDCNDNPIERSV